MVASLPSTCTTASPINSRTGPVFPENCLSLILGRLKEALSTTLNWPFAIASSVARGRGSRSLMDHWLSLMGIRVFGLARWACTVASFLNGLFGSYFSLLHRFMFSFVFLEIFYSLHYTTVQLGTPGMKFMVALDTGSDLFWVPCDCSRCAPTEGSPYASVCFS